MPRRVKACTTVFVLIVNERLCALWTGGVIYQPPSQSSTLSEVLTPSILEGKGGNLVRGYPSILPCLLCLSCSLCFLNTIHAGRTEREREKLARTCSAKTCRGERVMTRSETKRENTTRTADAEWRSLQMVVR